MGLRRAPRQLERRGRRRLARKHRARRDFGRSDLAKRPIRGTSNNSTVPSEGVRLTLDRTSVVGTSGTGKTTFARNLASLLNSPFVELDALHWGPNWTPRELDVFRAAVEARAAEDRWVIDGNYGKVRDIVWPRASTIIWLNYSLPTSFFRVLRRCVKRLITREEIFSGNRESFSMTFLSKDSILWWVLTTHTGRRRRHRSRFESGEQGKAAVIEFRNPREADAFLRQVKAW